jgi:hypothetical protein
MYPLDLILDNLPDNSKLSLINPVENPTEFLTVLKLPSELFISNEALSDAALVKIFMLPPKAAEPLVEVPYTSLNLNTFN